MSRRRLLRWIVFGLVLLPIAATRIAAQPAPSAPMATAAPPSSTASGATAVAPSTAAPPQPGASPAAAPPLSASATATAAAPARDDQASANDAARSGRTGPSLASSIAFGLVLLVVAGVLVALAFATYKVLARFGTALDQRLPIGTRGHWGGFGGAESGWDVTPALALLIAALVLAIATAGLGGVLVSSTLEWRKAELAAAKKGASEDAGEKSGSSAAATKGGKPAATPGGSAAPTGAGEGTRE